jgi:DNA-3-methyladenine glycosylase
VARLGRSFFGAETELVARQLVGAVLWSRSDEGETAGRIVEVEAYLDQRDPASHAAWLKRGQRIMIAPPGTVYMYRSYGMHTMFNVVTEAEGVAGAVLVRALEPVSGIELMQKRRGTSDHRLLCSGPGRLCQAMGLTLDHNGDDLETSERIWIATGKPPQRLTTTVRIGITKGADLPLRFVDIDSPFASRRSPISERPG